MLYKMEHRHLRKVLRKITEERNATDSKIIAFSLGSINGRVELLYEQYNNNNNKISDETFIACRMELLTELKATLVQINIIEFEDLLRAEKKR